MKTFTVDLILGNTYESREVIADDVLVNKYSYRFVNHKGKQHTTVAYYPINNTVVTVEQND